MIALFLAVVRFAFPDFADLFPRPFQKRAVRVRKHWRGGVKIRAYTREIAVPLARPDAQKPARGHPGKRVVQAAPNCADPNYDPYAYLDHNLGQPVVQQEIAEQDGLYYTTRRIVDKLVLPPGARITHAPRFETESWFTGEDGWHSNSVIKTNGDIAIRETRYKKGRQG